MPKLRNAGAKGAPEFPEPIVLSNLASAEDGDSGGYPQPFIFGDVCEPAHFEGGELAVGRRNNAAIPPFHVGKRGPHMERGMPSRQEWGVVILGSLEVTQP